MNTRRKTRIPSETELVQLSGRGRKVTAVPIPQPDMTGTHKKGKHHPQISNHNNDSSETNRRVQVTNESSNIFGSNESLAHNETQRQQQDLLNVSSRSLETAFNRTEYETMYENQGDVRNDHNSSFANMPPDTIGSHNVQSSQQSEQAILRNSTVQTTQSITMPLVTAHSSKDPRFSTVTSQPFITTTIDRSQLSQSLYQGQLRNQGDPQIYSQAHIIPSTTATSANTIHAPTPYMNAASAPTLPPQTMSQQIHLPQARVTYQEPETTQAFSRDAWLSSLHPMDRIRLQDFASNGNHYGQSHHQNTTQLVTPQDRLNTSVVALPGSPQPIPYTTATNTAQIPNPSLTRNNEHSRDQNLPSQNAFHHRHQILYNAPPVTHYPPNQALFQNTALPPQQTQQNIPPPQTMQHAPQQGIQYAQNPNITPLTRTVGRQFLRNLEPPKFTGVRDAISAYDFLEYLEKYQIATGLSDPEIIYGIIPFALTGEAYSWFLTEQHISAFDDLDDFSARFRRHFQSYSYIQELEEELERRSQNHDEPLSRYISKILEYYRRLSRPIIDRDVIQRIIRKLNPTYAAYFRRALDYQNLQHFKEEAEIVDAQIARIKNYRPPPRTSSENNYTRSHEYQKANRYSPNHMVSHQNSSGGNGYDYNTRHLQNETYRTRFQSQNASYGAPDHSVNTRNESPYRPYNYTQRTENDYRRTPTRDFSPGTRHDFREERKVNFSYEPAGSPVQNNNHPRQSRLEAHHSYNERQSSRERERRPDTPASSNQRQNRSPTPFRNDRSSSRDRNNIKCFNCGDNHYASECPKKNSGNDQNPSQRRQ